MTGSASKPVGQFANLIGHFVPETRRVTVAVVRVHFFVYVRKRLKDREQASESGWVEGIIANAVKLCPHRASAAHGGYSRFMNSKGCV